MATEVRRDGEVRKTYDSGNQAEDENSAFHWLLKHQGQSVEWALRYEGWSFAESPSSAEPRVSVIHQGLNGGERTYKLLFSEDPEQKLGPFASDEAVAHLQRLTQLGPEAADSLVGTAVVDRMATRRLSEETARG
jgi:hypothetical protein